MSKDWKTVRDERTMAMESDAPPPQAASPAPRVGVPVGSGDDMVWHPLAMDRAGQARSEGSLKGKLLHDTNYECAFCRGEGERPLGTICPVCRRSGVVSLDPPVVVCAFCHGRGEVPPRSGITCTVCRGKGKVSVQEPLQTCPSCNGRGRKIGAALSCGQCRGVGVISVKRGGGQTGRASVLPSEMEALEAIADAGGHSGKTGVGRSMRVSSHYADQLCKDLAGKGLLTVRDVGVYALTDAGWATAGKSAARRTEEVKRV